MLTFLHTQNRFFFSQFHRGTLRCSSSKRHWTNDTVWRLGYSPGPSISNWRQGISNKSVGRKQSSFDIIVFTFCCFVFVMWQSLPSNGLTVNIRPRRRLWARLPLNNKLRRSVEMAATFSVIFERSVGVLSTANAERHPWKGIPTLALGRKGDNKHWMLRKVCRYLPWNDDPVVAMPCQHECVQSPHSTLPQW